MNWHVSTHADGLPQVVVDSAKWQAYDRRMTRQLAVLERRCGPIRRGPEQGSAALESLLQQRKRPKPR